MSARYCQLPVAVAPQTCTCLLAEPERLAGRPALLLNFAGDRRTSMQEHPYDIPVSAFLAAGHRAASFDLPCHGERTAAESPQGIAGFCAEVAAGRDVFGRFVEEGRAVVEAMLAGGLAEPGRIFAAGTSRGGYCALRLMAAEPRIAAGAAYAPVTDWRALAEFAPVRAQPEVAALALAEFAPALARRPVWVGIGNQDARVSTRLCLLFAAALLAAETAVGAAGPGLQLHVVPEDGHSLSDRWRQAGADFLLDQAAAA